jgi:hypothetical protein
MIIWNLRLANLRHLRLHLRYPWTSISGTGSVRIRPGRQAGLVGFIRLCSRRKDVPTAPRPALPLFNVKLYLTLLAGGAAAAAATSTTSVLSAPALATTAVLFELYQQSGEIIRMQNMQNMDFSLCCILQIAKGFTYFQVIACSAYFGACGFCGMARNAAEGRRASMGRVGEEGREGSEGMGVNERSSERGWEEGSSLRAGSMRDAMEGSEWRATFTPQATHTHCFSLHT